MKEEQSRMEPELIEQFIHAAEESTATVERIKRSPSDLKDALLNMIRDEDAAILSEPDDLDPKVFAPFRKDRKVITSPTESQLTSVKVGITDAFAGVARTGSVCVSVSKNLGGSVSLYTREHIAVLDALTIVPRPRDLFSETMLEGKGLTRDFVFITGPSATADMGSLVRGVHGPGKLHIIILE